jgi:hypothetical protein
MREPGRQHETAGVGTIGGIDLAEKTNLSVVMARSAI